MVRCRIRARKRLDAAGTIVFLCAVLCERVLLLMACASLESRCLPAEAIFSRGYFLTHY
jgi:hypothetical protein